MGRRYWFLSAPLPGHLDWGGALKTAVALQRRGADVLWVSGEKIRALVEAAGVPFVGIPETGWLWPPPPMPDAKDMHPVEAMFTRYRRALDTWLTPELIIPAVEQIVALAAERGSPDVIVTDPFLTASALAAEKLNVPLAVMGWPAGQPLDEDKLYAVQTDLSKLSHDRIGALLERFRLTGLNFSSGAAPSVQSPHLHISYFSREWHIADGEFLPQTRFVGGKVTLYAGDSAAWLADVPEHVPCALITLGSTFTGDPGFFAWTAQACARLRIVPIVVIGGNSIDADQKTQLKAALPPGTRLLNWIDYEQVFPRLSVIIHHGGMGTTHRAIVQGIPQVCVPHAADQRANAKRVATAKIGLNLTAHDVRNGQLLPAIRAVTMDEKVKQVCRELVESFAALGGVDRAAELLEGITGK